MSNGFMVCPAPDSHISYLHEHPGLVHYYLDGVKPPEAEISGSLPDWWPGQPPHSHQSWSVNYRNADLYHWILNKSSELVTGGGSFFQTWYEPEHAADVTKLDKHNERFAFLSNQISELELLAADVDLSSVHEAFVEWCKSQGKEYEDIDEYACEPFVSEFRVLGAILHEAAPKGFGIIW
jgi:hypothetical protein